MNVRRSIPGLALLAVLSLQLSPGGPTRAWAEAARSLPAPSAAAHGLGWIELLTPGALAEEPLPLIVAIHGLGDSPERFQELVRTLPFPARVVVPRAPDP